MHADARNALPFKTNAFNAAHDVALIINLIKDDERDFFLSEVWRVLKPDSILAVTIPVIPDGFYALLVKEQNNRAVVHGPKGTELTQKVYTEEEITKV